MSKVYTHQIADGVVEFLNEADIDWPEFDPSTPTPAFERKPYVGWQSSEELHVTQTAVVARSSERTRASRAHQQIEHSIDVFVGRMISRDPDEEIDQSDEIRRFAEDVADSVFGINLTEVDEDLKNARLLSVTIDSPDVPEYLREHGVVIFAIKIVFIEIR